MQSLCIEGVSKRYGPVVALEPTSLNVAAGEFLTLLGPSGSGKTTLLSLIAGLAEPDSGRILLNGGDISRAPAHQRGLGVVFQNYALFPHMSVAENVAFGLQARRLSVTEVQEKVRHALAMVRLEALGRRMPKELSGGQQQRVALARALAYQPSIVLMDEPLGALDRNLREEMKFEIARLHRELGTSIVYVTHDQEEAMVLSDRVCLMNHAKVEQVARPETLYFHPDTRFAAEFLGESNLLKCDVLPSIDGSGLRVAVNDDGLQFDFKTATGSPGTGLLLLRPESIGVAEPNAAHAPDQLRLSGTLIERTFLGAMTRLKVGIANTTLKVLQRTESLNALNGFVLGRAIDLSIDVTRCHVLRT